MVRWAQDYFSIFLLNQTERSKEGKMKNVLGILLVVLLGVSSGYSAFAKETKGPIDQRLDVKLAQSLMACIDYDRFIIDQDRLKSQFLPLLDLGQNGKAIYGKFGINTDGRWFHIVVEKKSKSGATTGYLLFISRGINAYMAVAPVI
jgi:hypothetical protein